MRLPFALALCVFKSITVFAQRDVPIQEKIFQLSLSPALGTNGLHPGSFENYFAINLTSGYSSANIILEIATISNLNVNYTRGVQLAGLSNITGGNAFGALTKKESLQKVKEGFAPYLSGAQFSGLTNIVLGPVFGGQFTGGINLTKDALTGWQLSGIANIVYKYSFGLQTSALFNASVYSFDGVQIAGLSNYTRGELAGLQLALLNQAGDIAGRNTYNSTNPTALQLGLFNFARNMDGFQVGLINFARRSQGTQIGLINIYRAGKQTETRDGTAIGLLNFGSLTSLSFYANELFALNYELSTGNRKNGRIKMDRANVYVTNALIYSHHAFHDESWALGYGLKKMFFNRSEMPGQTESKFIGYGIDLIHLNKEKGKLTKELNLITRLKILAGTRIAPKLPGINWFAALSINARATDTTDELPADLLRTSQNVADLRLTFWPGLSLGILIH